MSIRRNGSRSAAWCLAFATLTCACASGDPHATGNTTFDAGAAGQTGTAGQTGAGGQTGASGQTGAGGQTGAAGQTGGAGQNGAGGHVGAGGQTSSNAGAGGISQDGGAPALPGCDAVTAHMRANDSLDAMLRAFWNTSSTYLDATEPSNGKATGYWTFAQAFDAILDGAERTGGRKYQDQIAIFAAAQGKRTWSSDWYDDENWLALALTRAFDLTGDHTYLDHAVTLYADITAAWDATSAHPGGIWWDRKHTQKATASNAGPVITGARLAARTGNAAQLTFARQVYDFWFKTMVDPTTHKLADHILPDGTIARGTLTYNEGLMGGAAQALFLATGEAKFLTDAHAIMGALVKNSTKTTSAGRVLSDGTNTSCTGDCTQFKGIGYRYLALLFRADPTHAEYRPALEGSVAAAWTLARTAATGLYSNDWAGPPTATTQIEGQSSTAMALNVFAELCGPYPGN